MRDLGQFDIATVREIDRLAFPASDQYDANFYEAVIGSDNFDAICVTTADGEVVGWALADLTRQPIRIRSLSVHPKFRGRGFAVALMRRILDRHRAPIDLLVDGNNAAAIALYGRLGFVEADSDPEMPVKKRMVFLPPTSGATLS